MEMEKFEDAKYNKKGILKLNNRIEKTKENFDNQKTSNRNERSQKEVKCFTCQQLGHYASTCPQTKPINHIETGRYDLEDIDSRTIKIQNRHFQAIFDTGAGASFITSAILKEGKLGEISECEEVAKLINGEEIGIKRKIKISFEYKDKKYVNDFL